MSHRSHRDVAIVGGGLAGLTLARHLLRETGRRVLLVERRDELPPRRQKVGESTVQVGGFYLSRVLGLEEHLLREHFMKYNLRFYWKTAGRPADAFENYGQAYIRPFSNVASYQLDRNKLEAEILARCRADERFELVTGVRRLEVELGDGGGHELSWEAKGDRRTVVADWVVDASGRGRFLARREELTQENPIRHGAFFWWVDGRVDLEGLTDLTPGEVRKHPNRRATGHLPLWLATNHFMGEGFWFWVIPLHGKTSLGLVYDRRLIDTEEVFSVEKATEWVCREFPLFARDLPRREVLDFAGFKDFSYDCRLTLDPRGWALTGEAGRFSDPLYSPGSDLIALHNTLIVAAIQTPEKQRASLCALYEQAMRSLYAAYEPSYAESYDALGDQETFVLKYTWELTVYFGFYVFPFLNDLFADRRFLVTYLRHFSRLGAINRCLHALLSDYYQWKKKLDAADRSQPRFVELLDNEALRTAESTFYEMGVDVDQAKEILRGQLANAEELARFIGAWIVSAVLDDPEAMTDAGLVAALDPRRLRFDPAAFATLWAESRSGAVWPWRFDPRMAEAFRARRAPAPAPAPAEVG